MSTITATHQRRAVEANGTVHAARYAGDRAHFTTACAVYPAPTAERLDATPALSVTCAGCLAALTTTDCFGCGRDIPATEVWCSWTCRNHDDRHDD